MNRARSNHFPLRWRALWPYCIAAAGVWLLAFAFTQTTAGEQTPDDDRPHLLREGTPLRRIVGTFQPGENRVAFVRKDAAERWTVLENLALQRVLQAQEERNLAPAWSVDAVVTEFRSANYLLIRRATIAE